MKTKALLKYLKITRATAVRAAGFLALAKEKECAMCSGYQYNIEPALNDISSVVDRENQLTELLDGDKDVG